MGIEELVGYWPVALQKYRRGKLYISDVEQALDEDGPIPEYVKPFVRDLIHKKVKFIRGRRSDWSDQAWSMMVRNVETLKRDIERCRAREPHDEILSAFPDLARHIETLAARHESALTVAIEEIANQHQDVTFEQLKRKRERDMGARKS